MLLRDAKKGNINYGWDVKREKGYRSTSEPALRLRIIMGPDSSLGRAKVGVPAEGMSCGLGGTMSILGRLADSGVLGGKTSCKPSGTRLCGLLCCCWY